jgi:hypothetical protein
VAARVYKRIVKILRSPSPSWQDTRTPLVSPWIPAILRKGIRAESFQSGVSSLPPSGLQRFLKWAVVGSSVEILGLMTQIRMWLKQLTWNRQVVQER